MSLYNRVLCSLLCLSLLLGGCSGGAPVTTTGTQPQGASSPTLTTNNATATEHPTQSVAYYDDVQKVSFYQFLEDYKESADFGMLTARGMLPKIPNTGLEDDWGNTPVPLINPLGSKALYESVSFRENQGFQMYYLQGFTEVREYVSGDQWTLRINNQGVDIVPFIQQHIEELGGVELPTASSDRLAFYIRFPDSMYRCQVIVAKYHVTLEVVRHLVYHINQDYTITQDMFADNKFSFYIEMPGVKYSTFSCGIPDGSASIRFVQVLRSEKTETHLDFRKNMYSERYDHYTFYDLPQDPGW